MSNVTFDVVLRVTARNFTREEAEAEGFELEADEDPADDGVDSDTIGECMAESFHEEAVREMLAGSNLMATVEAVELVRVEEPE
jgi:hypothetical protein